MNEPTMDKLVQRMDRLERENRWFKRIGLLGLVGIAAVMLMGQAPKTNKIIEAEGFVVKDQKGNVRAVLGEAKPLPYRVRQPEHGLFLYSEDGKSGAQLSPYHFGLSDEKSSATFHTVGINIKEYKRNFEERLKAHKEIQKIDIKKKEPN